MALRPNVCDLLGFLVERAGRLASEQDLLDAFFGPTPMSPTPS